MLSHSLAFCLNQVIDVLTRSNAVLDILFVSANLHISDSGVIALSEKFDHGMIFCNNNLESNSRSGIF